MRNIVQRAVDTARLLDVYGTLLTPLQQRMLRLHYEQDYTLAEIADAEGVTRQAAHDAVRKGETRLAALEREAGLLARLDAARQTMQDALSALEANRHEEAAQRLRDALQADNP